MLSPIVNFTPYSALIGGALIGGAAALLLAAAGRIAGISGMLHGLFDRAAAPRMPRLLFLLGLLAGAIAYGLLRPDAIPVRQGFPGGVIVLAGLLVGAGTRLGSGCTSGHGVCGIGRRSKRSIVATLIFMATGIATAVVARHLLGVGA